MVLTWLGRGVRRFSPSRRSFRHQAAGELSPRLEALEDRVLLSTFVVTNTNDSGDGSLRAAIQAANSGSGGDTIAFNISDGGAQTIKPASALPTITQSVTIDGTTQSGFAGSPLIVLDGSNVGGNGLVISAGNSTVRGLVVDNFRTGYGIELLNNGGNLIAGDYLGTDAAGAVSARNQGGLQILNSAGNTIGGATADARNVIAGNTTYGIFLDGSSDSNLVEGNYLGTDATGTHALGNSYDMRVDASNNTIGGTDAGSGNLISGSFYGVNIDSGTGNQIQGNYIGTDVTGTHALGNNFGVTLWYTQSGATIGGTAPGSGNLISGNTTDGLQIFSDDNLVEGNTIGTDVTGTKALGNGGNGVDLTNGSNNTIGGTDVGAGNLISGNMGNGITLAASAGNGNNNIIQGNTIGTDVNGTAALGNSIGVSLNNMTGTLIGGTAAGAGNLISGNRGDGIFFFTGSNNQVEGNLIGTDASGTRALGNTNGVNLTSGASGNTVGGTAAGSGNLISGNNEEGVALSASSNVVQGNLIGTDVTGSRPLGNGIGVFVGSNAASNSIGGSGAGAGNIISGSFGSAAGVEIMGHNNILQGNFVGTDVSGAAAIPNNNFGVLVLGNSNQIGGTAPGAGNLVSGNSLHGMGIAGIGNIVQGNDIGTDVTGMQALPNVGIGLTISGSSTLVGGTAAGAGNLVSGNQAAGIEIAGDGTRLQGNLIGTDASGTQALGNGGIGVWLFSGSNTTIGGTAAGAGNLISGNMGDGLTLTNLPINTLVEGNTIGTDVAGTQALGNGGSGITVSNGARGTIIGGTASGAGNLISGNAADGIAVRADGTLVQGNSIGTDATGSQPLGNGGNGVSVVGLGISATIGGTAIGAGNVIAFNGNDGVLVDSAAGTAILSDLIFASGNLGIELLHNGNNNQAAPALTLAVEDGASTVIQGTLQSTANITFTVQLFADPSADPSGSAEGQQFLGSVTVTTDAFGFVSFTVPIAQVVPAGQVITATATDASNNTSEFSLPVTVTAA